MDTAIKGEVDLKCKYCGNTDNSMKCRFSYIWRDRAFEYQYRTNVGLYEFCGKCLRSSERSAIPGIRFQDLTRGLEFAIPRQVWEGLMFWQKKRWAYYNCHAPTFYGKISFSRFWYEVLCAILLGALAINGFKGK